jgi:hypothetical protein
VDIYGPLITKRVKILNFFTGSTEFLFRCDPEKGDNQLAFPGKSIFDVGKAKPGPGSVTQVEARNADDPIKDHGDPDRQNSAADPTGYKVTAPHPYHQHGAY